ncbi:EF-hand domain-containing protein [Nostoc sp. ChiVER01]|uniref:EF-hand domain-containing protein n=1 Tax=Nostoc sp. ChiVER01 TaxID=3075382 RepID=UPI002AD2AA94|nr:EF-hand domain-containing protein [Nostoc sp. ChiVER01]MDZ8227997.1 EF-hand domain-containing protein [Nostoc sp. ChiVER01]
MVTEQELQEIFNELDSDGDGKVHIDELISNKNQALYLSTLAETGNFNNLLTQYDSDSDGSLSFEELKTAVSAAGNLED